MEQLQFLYIKYKYVLANAILLLAIVVAILGKTDGVRSFSLGVAAGITVIGLGESIHRFTKRETKKVPGE